MKKSVSVITNALFEKLPRDLPYYTQDVLIQSGFPPFLVKRISQYVYVKILENFSLPDQQWLHIEADSIQEAWQDLAAAIKLELRVPSDFLQKILKDAVQDCLELTVQPRKAIGKHLFRDDPELGIADITERASSITVNRYLVWSLVRYMEKKEKTVIDRKRADQILEKIDEKVVENYHPLNWLALVKPLFELCGPYVPSDLLRIFFEDKKINPAAKEFDLMNSKINESEFIEALSSPDLLYVEGFKDDQQKLFSEDLDSDLEDPLNQKFMSSTDDLPEIIPVEEEITVPDSPVSSSEESLAEYDKTAPWDEEAENEVIDQTDQTEDTPIALADTFLEDEEVEEEVLQPLTKTEDETSESVENEISFSDEELQIEEDSEAGFVAKEDTTDDRIGIDAIEIDETEADETTFKEKSLADSFSETETERESTDDPHEEIGSSDKKKNEKPDEVKNKLIEIRDDEPGQEYDQKGDMTIKDTASEDDVAVIKDDQIDSGTESDAMDIDEADEESAEDEESLASRFMFDVDPDDEAENVDDQDEVSTIYEELNLKRKGDETSTLDLFSMPEAEDEGVLADNTFQEPELDQSPIQEEDPEDEPTLIIDTTGSDSDDPEGEELPMWRSFLEREEVESASTFQFDDSRFGITGEDEKGEDEADQIEEADEDQVDEDGFIEEPIYDLTKKELPIEQKIGDLNDWMLDEKERFIEEIFGDSEDAYEQALADIIEYDNWKNASRYIEKEIFARNRVDLYDEVAVDFTDRLHSFFLEKKS